MGKALQPGSSLTRPSTSDKSKDNIVQQTIKPNNDKNYKLINMNDEHEWCDSQTFGGIQRFEEKYISLSSSRLKHQHRLTTNALAPILSIPMQGNVTMDVYIFAIVVDAEDKERRQHIPDSWQGRVRHIPEARNAQPTVGATSFMETLETSDSNYQLT